MSFAQDPTARVRDFNLAEHVLCTAQAEGDKCALKVVGTAGVERAFSYHTLTQAVLGTATGLLDAGLKPGHILLMRLGNTPDFPIAYLGAIAAGMVPVPTSSALTTSEVAKICDILNPAAILRDPLVPSVETVREISVTRLREMHNRRPAQWHRGDPNRLAYIVFTSGTSGRAMPVMHAHRAILARQMMFQGWYGLRADDHMMHAGAFNWTYTLGTGLMDPWTVGATSVIASPGTANFDLPGLMSAHNISLFAAAPGVYRQMLKHHEAINAPDLRHGLSAGEKLSHETAQAWTAATGTQIFEAFGMSECSTFVSGSPANPANPGTLGAPQLGRKVAILKDGRQQPIGQTGTIAIHKDDPGLMLGYLNAAQETAQKFAGPWFLTGDEGVMDAQGHITYLGRRDDMMNAGGFRVSPLEVEAALATAPGVTAIATAQVQVKPGVEVIAGFYTSRTPLDEDALKAYAMDKLARYKQPRLYVHLDALPMGANGKIQRRSLRAHFEAPDD